MCPLSYAQSLGAGHQPLVRAVLHSPDIHLNAVGIAIGAVDVTQGDPQQPVHEYGLAAGAVGDVSIV